MIISGIMTGLSWLRYFKALQLGKATKVVTVDKFSLVFILLLSVLILREKHKFKDAHHLYFNNNRNHFDGDLIKLYSFCKKLYIHRYCRMFYCMSVQNRGFRFFLLHC